MHLLQGYTIIRQVQPYCSSINTFIVYYYYRSLGRIFFGALGTTVYFSDVILADILTSFAKVFADLYATLCHIIVLGGIDLSAPGLVTANSCGYHWFGPGLTA
jgi:hypothetical protein